MSLPSRNSFSSKRKFLAYIERVSLLLVMVSLAGVGLHFLNGSQAATPFVSTEAENGTITAPATSVTDTLASGGRATRFTTGTTPPPPPPPPAGAGCYINSVAAPCTGGGTVGGSGWGTAIFTDEFTGTALDANKWVPCFFPASYPGSNNCGGMNDSITSKLNVRMENGAVVLRQSSVIENSASDVGALINTQPGQVGSGKGFQMGLGYAEARVWFPGNGSRCYNWPAWWINGGAAGFSDGEIDVAEIGGTGTMGSNYHIDRGAGREIIQNPIAGYWCDGYHIYGVDRQAGRNVIFYDGKQVASYTTYDNGAPQYLIFNVGYKTGKTPMAGAASDVRVDYVRVWKK